LNRTAIFRTDLPMSALLTDAGNFLSRGHRSFLFGKTFSAAWKRILTASMSCARNRPLPFCASFDSVVAGYKDKCARHGLFRLAKGGAEIDLVSTPPMAIANRQFYTSAMKPTTLVLRCAGTNCDGETAHAFELAGTASRFLHINRLLENRLP